MAEYRRGVRAQMFHRISRVQGGLSAEHDGSTWLRGDERGSKSRKMRDGGRSGYFLVTIPVIPTHGRVPYRIVELVVHERGAEEYGEI